MLILSISTMNMPPLSSQVKKRRLTTLFMLLGVGLFAFLIYRLGPGTLWNYLKEIGWNFIWILGISFLWFLCYTAAWEIFLKEIKSRLHFWNIFRFRVLGESFSHLTPLSWGGGDPIRIYLMKEHIPLREGTASVVVDRTLNNFAAALMLLGGIALTLWAFPLNLPIKIALGATFIALILGVIFFYSRSKEGLFKFGVDLLCKLRIKKQFSPKNLERFQQIDAQIARFYELSHKAFFTAFGLHLTGRLLGIGEIYLAAYFLGNPISLIESYLLASMTIILNMIFVFIPGSLGVLEGAYAGIFALVGKDPAVGASIQIVRRLRMVVWVLIGLIFLGFLRTPIKTQPPPHPYNIEVFSFFRKSGGF